ncbi:MAG: hypothetical protein LUP96_08110, partial [Methylococcaceae bacterium]|nr:hypothetical protein [Methylococcaceae bacterium]
PSKLADVPLSDKAIPYYYQQSGKPPLFELWNAEKTQHNRANQNLSYRSYQYQPVAPVFITDPLRYDLEPYNFLRIEGHLGKNYQSVMNTILTLKARYSLPIEVIALRTGAFDNTITVDLTKESSRFQDLEALYDVLREELLSNLCEGMMYLYDVVIDGAKLSGGTQKMPLLKNYAPNYRYKANTVGAWYEKYLTRIQAIPYIDVDQNAIDANTLFLVYCQLFNGTVAPDPKYYAHIVSIYYFSKLAEILPLSLGELGYANFENKYQDLLGLTRYFRGTVQVSMELQQFIPQEELIDHFDQVLFSCKLQPVKAVYDEYLRRLRELKQKQFLSDFLQKNPAIQHKAGVPLGGTFIIVYHDNPTPLKLSTTVLNTDFNQVVLRETSTRVISNAFARLQSKQDFVLDPDFQLIFSELTGQLPILNPSVIGVIQNIALDNILTETINGFTDGDVIADFYLPYRLNIDGQAVQFVIPAQSAFIASECEHEWIDSIKHVNNLTLRDYRFVSTNRVPPANEKEKNRLKDNYIISIYLYDIQGKSMLPVNQTVDIVIPLASFKTDKLSAIARELNNKFPSGLVFDAKPDSNKIIMRYLQGQQFRIELAGIQGNQIHYAYENTNVYRWQHQRWEKLDRAAGCDNVCHSLGSPYQEEAYQWLHENYPPNYPKPAPSPTAKETIEWEALTLARARQHQSIDALPIANLLFTIAQAIRQIDSNARVLLIGSWANGSWVSRRSADHAKEQNWSQFLALRQKVTGKTGYSDIDLLINSENEITAEMIEVSTGYQINIVRGAQDAQKGLVINRLA